MKVVAFLQNAWSSAYAGGTWPRSSWLAALNRSRSGQRLRVLTANCPSANIWWDNTTPIVGATPDSVLAPDFDHIHRVLHEQKPRMVLTLGKQAARALQHVWRGPTVIVPHPAYRVVTNELFEIAGQHLNDKPTARVVELTQERGRVVMRKESYE